MEYTISIDKSLLPTLPRAEIDLQVAVIDTPEEAARAIEDLKHRAIVGFDTETRPSFQKGRSNHTALMQIATSDKCYLFRLNKIGLTTGLIEFLEDGRIKKVGISLHDDFTVLSRDKIKVEPQGFIDLQPLVRNYRISDMSLQKIYAILFGKYISKHQRLTNWEAESLSVSQQRYAALDAAACLEIYNFLSEGKFNYEDCPHKKYPEEENEEKTEGDEQESEK